MNVIRKTMILGMNRAGTELNRKYRLRRSPHGTLN